ncbi:MAG TPA: DUF6042 family protein [Solirubrobacterales bacterium]|nr:DUF6042 family protein [Solirubrobacterales bacterium]
MPNPSLDLSSSGWIRNLPAPALRAYMSIWLLTKEGTPPVGDLDEKGSAFWVSQVAPRGLDEPYDPAEEKDWVDDLADEEALWEEWQGYAKSHERPLRSCRDVIEFMIELGLLERGSGDVRWRAVSPLPHVEDVLPLNAERKEIESQIRWRQSFHEVNEAITAWLAQRRPPGAAESEIETSIQAIAADLGYDPEDVRHGLAILFDEDIRCDVDPETAASEAPLRIRIDWELFVEWRTVYRVARPGEDSGH